MRQRISRIGTHFAAEQTGVAATEYLILLGLLTTAVIASVLLLGGDLGAVWTSWGEWLSTDSGNVNAPG